MAAMLVLGSLVFSAPATCDLPNPSGRINYAKLDYVACFQVAEWLSRTWYGSQGSSLRPQGSRLKGAILRLSATVEGSLSGDYTPNWDDNVFALVGRFTCGGDRPPTVAFAVGCSNDRGSWNGSIAWTGWLQTDCLEKSTGSEGDSWVLHTGWVMTHVVTSDDVSMKSGREDYRPRPAPKDR